MKLLIISNMAHYERDELIVGWGPTVEEIIHLAQNFSEVHHIACLYTEQAPKSALPYDANNLKFTFLPPTGCNNLKDKIEILRLIPLYVRTIIRELALADVVHVRCPANISLLAIVLLALVKKPRLRWVKYAGSWQPEKWPALTSRFQHWWLNEGVTSRSGYCKWKLALSTKARVFIS